MTMTELYVLRHGIAVPRGTPDIADDDRPLTDKGRKQMKKIGRGLRRLGIEPDRIVSSPLPRAWKTAGIVADALDLSEQLEQDDSLRADRSPESIRDWLLTRTEGRLMIVGHNPAFSALLGLLVIGKPDPWLCELKKGGVAAFSGRAEGKYVLEWIATPRILKRID